LSNDEVAMLVFDDGFTLKESVDEISGRGIGLSAIKHEVDKLNGKISIHTEKFVGTRFDISIPIVNI